MIYELMDRIGFCNEAKAMFTDAYTKIMADECARCDLFSAIDNFVLTDEDNYKNALETISKRLDINIYVLNMVFLLLAFRSLRHSYYNRGIADSVYWDTAKDLYYKNEECLRMYGVYGIEPLVWYRLFVHCNCFKIGRLEYEVKASPQSVPGFCEEGDKIINVHIPSSGPLHMEDVYDSFNHAFEFFGAKDEIIFMCASWLLYPPQADLLPDTSNIKKFQRLWHISMQREGMGDFWRVFYKPYPTDLNAIEPKTTLERVILDHLKAGNQMGLARGYIKYSPKCANRIYNGVEQ